MFKRWREIEINWPNLIYKDILVLAHLYGLRSYAIIEPHTVVVDIPTYERISGCTVPRTITVYIRSTKKQFNKVLDEALHLIKPIYDTCFPETDEDMARKCPQNWWASAIPSLDNDRRYEYCPLSDRFYGS